MKTNQVMTKEQQWQDKAFAKQVERQFPIRIQKDLFEIGITTDEVFTDSWYIHGKIGAGKTIRATSLLLNRIKADFISGAMVMGSGKSYKFIPLPNLLMDLRAVYSDPERTEKEAVDYYCGIDYLVIDDFGVAKLSDWVYQTLYLIINNRYEQLKPTIFTSNYTIKDIDKQLDDERLGRRIFQMCNKGENVLKLEI